MRYIEGIVFGQSRATGGETLSLFVRGEKAIIISLLIDTMSGNRLIRFSLQQLKELHEAIGKAIKWLEEK